MPDEALTEPDDHDLITRTALGDRAAFSTLVVRHQRAVYRVARALTGSDDAAEDILQETFLSALRGASGYRGEASVVSWLYAIARHAASRRGRRANQVPHEPASLEALGAAAGWGQVDVEAAAVLAEDRQRLARALELLPADEREVLVMRDLEELSGDEAATALGVSVAAMKSRLHRARLHLAAYLRQGGVSDVTGS